MAINTSRIINELISALALAMDIEGEKKLYHAWRVAIFAKEIAELEKFDEKKELFYSSLLHDVGGVGLPHHIVYYLLREQQLFNPTVSAHPLVSAEITSNIPGVSKASKFVLDHHEWWNGHGYPRGKQENEISLGGQIIRLADSIDLILQRGKVQFSDLVNGLSKHSTLSFSKRMADLGIEFLKQDNFYKEISEEEKLTKIFSDEKKEVGMIKVKSGTDAIGIALEVFSQIIDAKHPYTIGHSKRISRYSLLIAIALGLPHDEVTKIKWAALLHDIGKLSVPRRVLDKPSSLTKRQYEMVKKHANYTFEIVSTISDFKEIAKIASGHHERYNGSGYPLGLKGEEIPLGARILALADAFDAMTSGRPYRKSNDINKACDEIKRCAGVHFDPKIAKEAVPVLKNMGLSIGVR